MSGYRPLRNGGELNAGLYLPGAAGTYVSTPHVAGQAGDNMEWRFDVTYKTGVAVAGAAGKVASIGAAGSFGWYVFLRSSVDQMAARVSDGTASTASTAVAWATAAGLSEGDRVRLRATYTRDTGAGQYALAYYWSKDFGPALTDVTDWTQIGSTETGASIGASSDYNAPLTVGAYRASDAGWPGIYRDFVFYVNGTVYANLTWRSSPTPWTMAGTTYHDGARVWTLNGAQWEWRE